MNNMDFNFDEFDELDLEGIDVDGAKTETTEVTVDVDLAETEIKTDVTPAEVVIADEKIEATVIEGEDGTPDLNAFIGAVDEQTSKPKKEKKKAESNSKAPAYEGPRIIKVYGDELWVENDPKVTNEEIRQRIVDEFGYREFRKDKTIFDLDPATGILDVDKQFQKKG